MSRTPIQCTVCTTSEKARYKCPQCGIRYCSSACYKLHKSTPCDPAEKETSLSRYEQFVQSFQNENKAMPWDIDDEVPITKSQSETKIATAPPLTSKQLAVLDSDEQIMFSMNSESIQETLYQILTSKDPFKALEDEIERNAVFSIFSDKIIDALQR